MKFTVGDFISWGSWKCGWVLDVYPKGVLWLHGSSDLGLDHTNFLLDTKALPVENIRIIVPEIGYKFIHPPEVTKEGDHVWTGLSWANMPPDYQHPWSSFGVIRLE